MLKVNGIYLKLSTLCVFALLQLPAKAEYTSQSKKLSHDNFVYSYLLKKESLNKHTPESYISIKQENKASYDYLTKTRFIPGCGMQGDSIRLWESPNKKHRFVYFCGTSGKYSELIFFFEKGSKPRAKIQIYKKKPTFEFEKKFESLKVDTLAPFQITLDGEEARIIDLPISYILDLNASYNSFYFKKVSDNKAQYGNYLKQIQTKNDARELLFSSIAIMHFTTEKDQRCHKLFKLTENIEPNRISINSYEIFDFEKNIKTLVNCK